MKSLSFKDIAEPVTILKQHFTRRERILIQQFVELTQTKLNQTLVSKIKQSQDHAELFFELEEGKYLSGSTSVSNVELILTMFGSNCRIIVSSILALEIVNRFLGKILPAVDRELNQEEVGVIALIATLVISEFREVGVSGIYLKSVNLCDADLAKDTSDILAQELLCKQQLIVKLDSQLQQQLSDRAKLLLGKNPIQEITCSTSYSTRLLVNAEVQSLSTLLKLRPGVLWKLGNEIFPSVELDGKTIGFGTLIVTYKSGLTYEAA